MFDASPLVASADSAAISKRVCGESARTAACTARAARLCAGTLGNSVFLSLGERSRSLAAASGVERHQNGAAKDECFDCRRAGRAARVDERRLHAQAAAAASAHAQKATGGGTEIGLQCVPLLFTSSIPRIEASESDAGEPRVRGCS